MVWLAAGAATEEIECAHEQQQRDGLPDDAQTHQALAGIIITASVIDMGIVDQEIIEPDKKSYRQSPMIKTSLKSAYLRAPEELEKVPHH